MGKIGTAREKLASCAEVCRLAGAKSRAITSSFAANWAEGQELGLPAIVGYIQLHELGLPAIVGYIQT